jgi:type I restriction enzyme M protein
MRLLEILKDTEYNLDQFNSGVIEQLENRMTYKEMKSAQVPYVECLVRKKDIKLTPEEVVRQL